MQADLVHLSIGVIYILFEVVLFDGIVEMSACISNGISMGCPSPSKSEVGKIFQCHEKRSMGIVSSAGTNSACLTLKNTRLVERTESVRNKEYQFSNGCQPM
jgi:hypothetical protein